MIDWWWWWIFKLTTTSSKADESGVIDEFAVIFALKPGRGDGVDNKKPNSEIGVYHSHFPNCAPTVQFAKFPIDKRTFRTKKWIDFFGQLRKLSLLLKNTRMDLLTLCIKWQWQRPKEWIPNWPTARGSYLCCRCRKSPSSWTDFSLVFIFTRSTWWFEIKINYWRCHQSERERERVSWRSCWFCFLVEVLATRKPFLYLLDVQLVYQRDQWRHLSSLTFPFSLIYFFLYSVCNAFFLFHICSKA